jgi:hypothetical protein
LLVADWERELPLSELDERTWRSAWLLLHALALIGEQYPDREASIPKVVGSRA